MKNCKPVKFIACILLCAALITGLYVSADTYEEVPTPSYTYWSGGKTKKAVKTKALYSFYKYSELAEYDSGAAEPAHMAYSPDGKLYILDTNGKIMILDREYRLISEISSVNYGGENITFSGARGIYIASDGLLYICDTENKRVIICSGNTVERIITKPESSVIPSDFEFTPIRIVKDSRNFSYLLCDGCYYGLMVFDSDFGFIGFFGANKVVNSILDAVSNWFTSIFNTGEKHEATVKKLPYQITDITMNNGFVCAVNAEKKGQLRMFATTGDNILRYSEQYENGNGDEYNFADEPNSFVDVTDKWANLLTQSFSSVASDSFGYMYALDSMQGRIYIYDEECNIIGVFGGGMGSGSQKGTFATAGTLAIYGDDLAVIDIVKKSLTVFKITEYGKAVKNAQRLTLNGDYEKAYPVWQSVNSQDKNMQLAYLGLAKYYLGAGDYSSAMKYSKTGNDQTVYAQAFRSQRNMWIRGHLWLIGVIAAVIVIAAIAIRVYFKRKHINFRVNARIKNALKVLTHPIECFNNIKNHGMGSVAIATVLLILYYVTSISQKLLSGFMYQNTDLTSFNSVFTLLGTVGVMLLYVTVNWAACILFEGKGKFKQIYCASMYCLIPLILNSLLYIILSYVIIPDSNSGFGLLTVFFQAFFVILLLLSITVIHDFGFMKSVGLGIVIIIGMGIFGFVLFAVFSLAQDLISFVLGVIKEVALR